MKKYITSISFILLCVFLSYGQETFRREGKGTERDFSVKEQLAKLKSQDSKATASEEPPVTEDPEIYSKPARASLAPDVVIPELLTIEKLKNERKESFIQHSKHPELPNTSGNAPDQEVQPEGEKPQQVPRYREMNGPNTQPESIRPQRVINYREMNGSNVHSDLKNSDKK